MMDVNSGAIDEADFHERCSARPRSKQRPGLLRLRRSLLGRGESRSPPTLRIKMEKSRHSTISLQGLVWFLYGKKRGNEILCRIHQRKTKRPGGTDVLGKGCISVSWVNKREVHWWGSTTTWVKGL